MTSPLVRAWFAARLVDWVDHAYACWRSLHHALTCRPCRQGQLLYCPREWDPCQIQARYLIEAMYLTGVPVPAGSAVAAGTTPGAVTAAGLGTAPPPALHLMLPCGTCGAHANAPCVTRKGEQTGPHKKRRIAAADATLGGEA